MATKNMTLRCYGVREEGVWQVLCLDFNLAAQDESFDVAMNKLKAQIVEYYHDATVGAHKEWKEQLLSRRAPPQYWISFYWFKCVFRLHAMIKLLNLDWLKSTHKSFNCTVPKMSRC